VDKVTRFWSVFSYSKHCGSVRKHHNSKNLHHCTSCLALPCFIQAHLANDFVTYLLHKSTFSALSPPKQYTAIICVSRTLSITYNQST